MEGRGMNVFYQNQSSSQLFFCFIPRHYLTYPKCINLILQVVFLLLLIPFSGSLEYDTFHSLWDEQNKTMSDNEKRYSLHLELEFIVVIFWMSAQNKVKVYSKQMCFKIWINLKLVWGCWMPINKCIIWCKIWEDSFPTNVFDGCHRCLQNYPDWDGLCILF